MPGPHGGARKKERADDGRGGARPGSGPPLRRIRIGPEAARKLKALILASGQEYGEEVVNAWVERQILSQGTAAPEAAGLRASRLEAPGAAEAQREQAPSPEPAP